MSNPSRIAVIRPQTQSALRSDRQVPYIVQMLSAIFSIVLGIASILVAIIAMNGETNIKKMSELLGNQQAEIRELAKSNGYQKSQIDTLSLIQKSTFNQSQTLIELGKSAQMQNEKMASLVTSSKNSVEKLSQQLSINSKLLYLQKGESEAEQRSEYFRLRNIFAQTLVPPYSGWYMSLSDAGRFLYETNDSTNLNFFEKFKANLERGFDNRYLLKDSAAYSVWFALYEANSTVLFKLRRVMDPDTKYYSDRGPVDVYAKYRHDYFDSYLNGFCEAYWKFDKYFKAKLNLGQYDLR